ncbi:hypothetical protein KUF71_012350 [Frankliniella fusca]|uniref:Uncharacterized protein n=1 Tax=Frankliniella fusca TaxID=407009 RepID=A0AAE1HN47_9NEOP|nr:hypothetical protein KUF71_012350 [Frankliniella fusca]
MEIEDTVLELKFLLEARTVPLEPKCYNLKEDSVYAWVTLRGYGRDHFTPQPQKLLSGGVELELTVLLTALLTVLPTALRTALRTASLTPLLRALPTALRTASLMPLLTGLLTGLLTALLTGLLTTLLTTLLIGLLTGLLTALLTTLLTLPLTGLPSDYPADRRPQGSSVEVRTCTGKMGTVRPALGRSFQSTGEENTDVRLVSLYMLSAKGPQAAHLKDLIGRT